MSKISDKQYSIFAKRGLSSLTVIIVLLSCLVQTSLQLSCVNGCQSCSSLTGKCASCYPYYTQKDNGPAGGVDCEDTVDAKVAELNKANSGLPKPFIITIIYGSWMVLFIAVVCCCHGLFKEEFPMPEDLVQQGPNPAMNHLNQMAKA